MAQRMAALLDFPMVECWVSAKASLKETTKVGPLGRAKGSNSGALTAAESAFLLGLRLGQKMEIE